MTHLNNLLLSAMVLMAMACGGNNNDERPDNITPPTTEVKLKSVTYRQSNDEIANPERGLYTQLECNATESVSLSSLVKLRSEGKTLVQLMYYLPQYRNTDLPETFATKLSADLNLVEQAGLKAILRFAYTDSQEGEDAPMNIIKRHLDQIKPTLHEQVGVIACVQAGFIGAWGEWYYSTNKLNNTASYAELLNKWLEVLPAERCVQVRVPRYKKDFLGNSTALTPETAFKNTPAARIGHHNDAFMTNETNMGTYLDLKNDRMYVAQEGLFVPLGGETANPGKGAVLSTGDQALTEIQTLHWSFLNDAYYTPMLDNWKKGGYFNKIKKLLGYRIFLNKAGFTEQNAPGSDLSLNLTFGNAGTACLYNARPVVLVLCSENNSSEYVATTDIDLRQVQPERMATFKLQVKLPSNLPEGKYKLKLWLPDGSKALRNNPVYAVRLANTTVWDKQKGYNDMDIAITVAKDKNAKAGSSTLVFSKK